MKCGPSDKEVVMRQTGELYSNIDWSFWAFGFKNLKETVQVLFKKKGRDFKFLSTITNLKFYKNWDPQASCSCGELHSLGYCKLSSHSGSFLCIFDSWSRLYKEKLTWGLWTIWSSASQFRNDREEVISRRLQSVYTGYDCHKITRAIFFELKIMDALVFGMFRVR